MTTSNIDPVSAEFQLSLQDFESEQASPARVYDYWLGGSANFAADRDVGQRIADQMPRLIPTVRANRHYLHRVVRHLVQAHEIVQFLDLGSGVPTAGNVHEIARALDPRARVVYVDVDPVAVAHATTILAQDDQASAILADLKEPATILDHPRLRSLLDLDQPVALLLNAVLHFIPDAEDPAGIIAAYLAPLAPGSAIALSHSGTDPDPAIQAAVNEDYARSTGIEFTPRTPAQIAPWLAGLEIEPPGIVPITQWRPDDVPQLPAADLQPMYAALARKP